MKRAIFDNAEGIFFTKIIFMAVWNAIAIVNPHQRNWHQMSSLPASRGSACCLFVRTVYVLHSHFGCVRREMRMHCVLFMTVARREYVEKCVWKLGAEGGES